jgi:hypothetical protein
LKKRIISLKNVKQAKQELKKLLKKKFVRNFGVRTGENSLNSSLEKVVTREIFTLSYC